MSLSVAFFFFFLRNGNESQIFTKSNRGAPVPSSFRRVFKQSPQYAHDKSWPLKNSEPIRQHGSGSWQRQLEVNEGISIGAPLGGRCSKQ